MGEICIKYIGYVLVTTLKKRKRVHNSWDVLYKAIQLPVIYACLDIM